jgi:hypothetical protein
MQQLHPTLAVEVTKQYSTEQVRAAERRRQVRAARSSQEQGTPIRRPAGSPLVVLVLATSVVLPVLFLGFPWHGSSSLLPTHDTGVVTTPA